jgi:ornithine cyclodeaminase/alanine dehydrogenase-like protein (mu-crystallin family)
VRNFEEVRVASRDRARAEQLADEIGATVAGSWQEALDGADVVAATTHAAEPVVRREWLADGVHVNSVGANPSGTGEVDAATVAGALVAVESRESTLAPPPAGAVELRGADPENLVELGELVAGTRQGRGSPDQVTLYKSVGVAVQDAAAAALVLKAARSRQVGRTIELEEIELR